MGTGAQALGPFSAASLRPLSGSGQDLNWVPYGTLALLVAVLLCNKTDLGTLTFKLVCHTSVSRMIELYSEITLSRLGLFLNKSLSYKIRIVVKFV